MQHEDSANIAEFNESKTGKAIRVKGRGGP
jgi:hypothetical protein